MTKYKIYENAGKVPYAEWKESGIVVPIFDLDGTFTSFQALEIIPEVENGLREQGMPDIFPEVALVSNNKNSEHVNDFAKILHDRLGVDVHPIASGWSEHAGESLNPKKPSPFMGQKLMEQLDVANGEIGVIGDRYLTDVKFGLSLKAAEIALCKKVGVGDDKWVPTLRKIEAMIVARDIKTGRASVA